MIIILSNPEHGLISPCPVIFHVPASELQPHTCVFACLYNVSFKVSDSSEVLNRSLTSKDCSPLAALRKPSRLLGKLGRPSRSRREPSSSKHLHRDGRGMAGRVVCKLNEYGWEEEKR